MAAVAVVEETTCALTTPLPYSTSAPASTGGGAGTKASGGGVEARGRGGGAWGRGAGDERRRGGAARAALFHAPGLHAAAVSTGGVDDLRFFLPQANELVVATVARWWSLPPLLFAMLSLQNRAPTTTGNVWIQINRQSYRIHRNSVASSKFCKSIVIF
uniref:Uncharacterized protein n=1 Tax=Oryza sativa subsp. japonica TaxID=39947 RepID=Q2QSD6_ORYSJ|nr:hypothetical protein LOC_Os12g24480 [Oryza sativa Japonica Group]